MEEEERSVTITGSAFKALARLKQSGERDADALQRAVALLDAHAVLSAGLPAGSPASAGVGLAELPKAALAVRQMRVAGYSEEKMVAVCRALFLDQSSENMEQAFKFFDADNCGSIDRTEFRQALQLMGEKVSDASIDQLFAAIDADASSKIDVKEFARLVRGMNPKGDFSDDTLNAIKDGADKAGKAIQDGADKVGHALQDWTAVASVGISNFANGVTTGASALGAAFAADLKGINPLEMKKAGTVINNMKAAGYSEHMANTICRALFCEQSEEDLKAAFEFFDKDDSGKIDKEEFRRALPLMGEDVPDEKVDEIMGGVDQNKTGQLEFADFCVLVRRMNPKESQVAEAKGEGDESNPLHEAWGKVTSGLGGLFAGEKDGPPSTAASSGSADKEAENKQSDGWFPKFQWPGGEETASVTDSKLEAKETAWGWPWPQGDGDSKQAETTPPPAAAPAEAGDPPPPGAMAAMPAEAPAPAAAEAPAAAPAEAASAPAAAASATAAFESAELATASTTAAPAPAAALVVQRGAAASQGAAAS